MIEVTFAGALLAGLLSFLSPCVLPLVPAYLSYISGTSVSALRSEQPALKRHALVQSIWFIAGFSLIFIALGASATFFGQWLMAHLAILGKVAGAIIIVFGLHYSGLFRIPWLMYEARFQAKVKATHGLGALVLGAAFAFGWTPCIGPILGAILAIAGAQNHVGKGVLLLMVYSGGLAIPFFLAALATDKFMRWSQKFRNHFRAVEIISGVLLITVGVLILLGSFSLLSNWLIEHFPFLANIDTVIN